MPRNKNPIIYDFKDKERTVKLYVKTMFDRTQAMFEYEGLPETVPARELERLLQEGGFAVWTKVNDELYAFTGGLDGQSENVYYDKSWATIANAPLNWSGTVYFKGNLKHEPNAVLMRNDTNMLGLWDINSKYATILAETDLTMYLVDIMSRATAILTANDDKTYLSAKKYLEDLQKGNLGVIAGNLMYESVKTQPYITEASETISNLIELEQYIKAGWFNEMGINANYNMKREALNSSESALNEEALKPFVDDMLNCRQRAIDEINEMFGLEITVKLSSTWEVNDKKEELELQALESEANGEDELGEETISETVTEEGTDETETDDIQTDNRTDPEETETTPTEVKEVNVEVTVNVDSEGETEEQAEPQEPEEEKEDDDEPS